MISIPNISKQTSSKIVVYIKLKESVDQYKKYSVPHIFIFIFAIYLLLNIKA
jgi:hypothetical protein